MARTDEFLKAIQNKELKTVKSMIDRMSFGDLSEAQITEMFSRLLSDKLELERWEFDDVQVKKAGPFGRQTGTCQMTYTAKVPKGELRLTDQWLHWGRKLDGWYLVRGPRPADK
jgi:hypothetical protein